MFQKIIQELMPPKKMIDTFILDLTSNQSIEEISQRVPEECETFKFALLQTYNYHEIVEGKSFPIKRKVFVYEICQAKTASAMLTDFPHFSIFMPCKLAIYEHEGKTVISTMNMDIMLKAIDSNQELYNEAITLFGSLKSLMKSLSNGK